MAENDCQLYLITPDKIDDVTAFAKLLDETLAAGEVACVQLRLKDVSDEDFIAAAEALKPVCEKHEVAFLINDRADIAAAVDADGVHLGQDDMDVPEARTLLGHNKDIGVTCHDSMDLAFSAGEQGANYVAFGAFFPTETKLTEHRPEKDILTVWDEVTELPCVAIGGITPENCKELADAGAHFVAACSSVWNHHEGPAAAVKAFNKALKG
ncbi:thiamine phosphate synthase [Kordiimonas marina]|uniref:thiamine phosphate synthase n=1 Tax=Kordiimonas marina TaxID=2872312 RepID=UPI001FF63E53|nr:thiamine phosphate synthase [Kordiimonas marina]MCJ9427920.1 thiamine phosphate synthase [Kordiimonas marina]